MGDKTDQIKGKLNGKELKSVIALFWILAVWIAVFSLPSTFGVEKVSYFGFPIPVWMYQLRSCGMFTLNVIVALYVEDKTEEFEKVFTQIWRIKLLETNPELVISMIQDTLASYNDLWSKIVDRINKCKLQEQKNVYARNNIMTKDEVVLLFEGQKI